MPPNFCKILPSLHSLTECDFTLSFSLNWQEVSLKIIENQSPERFEKLALMDDQYNDEIQTAAREFAALLSDSANKERKYYFLTSCAINWHCENATLLESFLPVKMTSNNM